MKEIIAYFCLPAVAFAWFVLFLEKDEIKTQDREKAQRKIEEAMEEHEDEMIKKIAELELENEEMEKKDKAEKERAKNSLFGFFKIKKNK